MTGGEDARRHGPRRRAEREPDVGGLEAHARASTTLFFFGFDLRLEGYAKRAAATRSAPIRSSPSSCRSTRREAHDAGAASWTPLGAVNAARRKLARILCAVRRLAVADDARASPSPGATTTSSKPGVSARRPRREALFAIPCQFTRAAQHHGHAGDLAAAGHALDGRADRRPDSPRRPADEHVLLQLAAALEQAMPWAIALPPLHVSKM